MYHSLFLVSPHLDRSRTPFPCSWFLRTRAGHVPSLDLGFQTLFLVSPLSRSAFVKTLPNPLSFAALPPSLALLVVLAVVLPRSRLLFRDAISFRHVHSRFDPRAAISHRWFRMCFDSYASFCFTSLCVMWKQSRLCVCVCMRDGRTDGRACAPARAFSVLCLSLSGILLP
jgi:hypothetical protein